MNFREAQQQLQNRLYPLYGDREAATIADWVMEEITGLQKIDRLLQKEASLSPDREDLLLKYSRELQAHRPVQYVLGQAWFGGLRFHVDERVLIPRPETEELAEWVVEEAASREALSCKLQAASHDSLKILDIGTGSGCIPVLLKKRFPEASVFACDISEGALDLAKENAEMNQAPIHFFHFDILEMLNPLPSSLSSSHSSLSSLSSLIPLFDLIVSNPPYIPVKDKGAMSPNVLEFEPHLALFVQDDDPVIFYRAIAAFARKQLAPGGQLFLEMHEELAGETSQALSAFGFSGIRIKKDMQGKARMINASMPIR